MVDREVDGQHVFISKYVFFIFFRLIVGLQVDGPLGVVLGGSKGLCGWSWAAPRASVGGPGPLSGPLWVALGRSQGLCGWSWAVLGSLLAVLGRSWSHVGGLGPQVGGLGLMLAVPGGPRPKSGPGPSGRQVPTSEACRRPFYAYLGFL